MKKAILYEDHLVRILDDSLVLKHYYLPFISKIISFSKIETIESREPILMETVLIFPLLIWRVYGLGIISHHMTWFPFDLFRGTREKIFIITYKNQKLRSGFTVENTDAVEGIIKEKEWIQNIFMK